MAVSHYERVGRAMESVRRGLGPFVEREVREGVGKGIVQMRTVRRCAGDPRAAERPLAEWDAAALLKVMWEVWNDVFRYTLGRTERSLVQELREWRNRWAHQERFSSDDAYRALDSAVRLLAAVSAPEAAEVEKSRAEVLRLRYDQQLRNQKKQAGGSLVEAAAGSLKPWRGVAMPHEDVATGQYQQAEFAADLWQVHRGEGTSEYREPAAFFRRTYLTENLRSLLAGAVRRLAGKGGDPVVQLQTNFGGGKTHSMLALYHLFSGAAPLDSDEVGAVLSDAGEKAPQRANRVVLVGNRISPGNPDVKPDGTEVRTLWGELAWQLGGREAFEQVRADDEKATSPGDRLRALLAAHGPTLVLIDEWVAYARQLHEQGDLPGGSFETQFTFAQALTESAKVVDDCLLVVSLPASAQGAEGTLAQPDDAEVGGVRGRDALDRLSRVVGRVGTVWHPATSEEAFEIVRRRLFEPLQGDDAFKARDLTARAFAELYRRAKGDFPQECRDTDYEKRIRAAYPVHPEVFDRLYTDWSSLGKFQRTRGVLRLMASVIHSLWESGDKNPLILPSMIPVSDPRVQPELTRYLPDNWTPIIEKDIDGPGSVPRRLDSESPNLGKLSATRRVARTVYMGSAPLTLVANRGIDDRRVNLGCVVPGEQVSLYGDALRRLAATATYLYQDGSRYWYATQPTVAKLAEQRAAKLADEPHRAAKEFARRLGKEFSGIGAEGLRVHLLPRSATDVPDAMDARLVVLPADNPYSKDDGDAATAAAEKILESRGTGPRIYRNTLLFLAADQVRMQDMDQALREYLAWQSILAETDALNLDPHQAKQAAMRAQSADQAVAARMPEVYKWLLAPEQDNATAPVQWRALQMRGGESVAAGVLDRIGREDLALPRMAATILRLHLDQVPLWRGDHVPVRQLAEDFATYLYLPRLKAPAVLADSVREGVGLLSWTLDSFAYADSYDEAEKRYSGLRAAVGVETTPDDHGLVVKPDVASAQLEREAPSPADPVPGVEDERAPVPEDDGDRPPEEDERPRARRFHGSVNLDPQRVGRDAGQIAEEVIAHLVGLVGSDVRVSLEIEADMPEGAPDRVVRAVTENSRQLKFSSHGFEAE